MYPETELHRALLLKRGVCGPAKCIVMCASTAGLLHIKGDVGSACVAIREIQDFVDRQSKRLSQTYRTALVPAPKR